MHHHQHNTAMDGFFRHDVVWQRALSNMGYRNVTVQRTLNQEIQRRETAGEYEGLSLADRTRIEWQHIHPILLKEESGFHLEPEVVQWKRELSESKHLESVLKKVYCEYLVLKGNNLRHENWKRSRFRDFLEEGEPFCSTPITDRDHYGHSFINWFVNFRNPIYGLEQSFWNRSECYFGSEVDYFMSKPMRAIFHLDFEYYNKLEPLKMLYDLDKVHVLNTLGHIVRNFLLNYGIHHVETQTGRGRNYDAQITIDSELMDMMILAGGLLEDTVKGRAKSTEWGSRRTKTVPLKVEALNRCMCRLQQYVVTQIKQELTYHIGREHNLGVEMSDCWIEGISADCTMAIREVWNSSFGVTPSPYTKFFDNAPGLIVDFPIPIRIPISYSGNILLNTVEEIQMVRNNIGEFLEYAQQTPGMIPDATKGLKLLLTEYLRSDLYLLLHRVMDEKEHQDPHLWESEEHLGYRRNDYHYLTPIIGQSVWQLNACPINNIKSPDKMHHVVDTLASAGFHPKDIAGTIRAMLEDGRFPWGHKFIKEDASRHANGWVELILGRHYERQYFC